MKKDALEKGYCTASRCRKAVGSGHGIQFVGKDGKKHRVCWECWQKYCSDNERNNDDFKGEEKAQNLAERRAVPCEA
jgi:ribosomal protein L24E